MTVTTTMLHYDLGRSFSALRELDGTTVVLSATVVAQAQITKATSVASAIGTSSDNVIRPLAAAYCCNQILLGFLPESQNETVMNASNAFMEEAKNNLRVLGFNIDGDLVKFKATNQ